MRLTEELKKKIDQYFENTSKEELLEKINKYCDDNDGKFIPEQQEEIEVTNNKESWGKGNFIGFDGEFYVVRKPYGKSSELVNYKPYKYARRIVK